MAERISDLAPTREGTALAHVGTQHESDATMTPYP
jgi:hypothetical protein